MTPQPHSPPDSPLAQGLDQARERVPLYIHIGHTLRQLASLSPEMREESLLMSHAVLTTAITDAKSLSDERSWAMAHLNLAALYADEQHRSEALYLTRSTAIEIDATDLIYRADWQEGQLLWAEHRVRESLAAHRRAVAILEETRPVVSAGYGNGDESFRRAVGGVYRDTVDVLLRSADLAVNEEIADSLVLEARTVLEQLKAAELRDYFEDECIGSVRNGGHVRELAPTTAVIHTISLPDRLELLVELPTGVERFTTSVRAEQLNETIDEFRLAVQDPLSTRHEALGQRLHNWIVSPYADRLADANIDTVVFVPDGRLRTLPFSALHDGTQYLGDQYSMATALSMNLLTSRSIESEAGRPVLAGVSESVQGFSALDAVDAELSEIQAIEGGEVLINADFTLDAVRAAVDREIPGVIHLATHAVFSGNPDTSFLLTYGGRVGFEELSDVVGMTGADGAPLELLVLSACETAVGNDRAGLGFTGSAIRAGARSALGSLWPISDYAAQTLMVEFYRGLQSPDLSKAQALRAAQEQLRDDEQYAHPFYWAPFTLVNDWL